MVAVKTTQIRMNPRPAPFGSPGTGVSDLLASTDLHSTTWRGPRRLFAQEFPGNVVKNTLAAEICWKL